MGHALHPAHPRGTEILNPSPSGGESEISSTCGHNLGAPIFDRIASRDDVDQIHTGAGRKAILTKHVLVKVTCPMTSTPDRFTLRRAAQARDDFAQVMDELDL